YFRGVQGPSFPRPVAPLFPHPPFRQVHLGLTVRPKYAKSLDYRGMLAFPARTSPGRLPRPELAFPVIQGWILAMATHTAPTSPPMPLISGPSPALTSRPRVLWPWPVFVLGVAALVGVWLGRPYLHQHLPNVSGDHLQRHLNEMRAILERKPGEMDKALALGQKVLDQAGDHPQITAEAHYLMGCIRLKKAEEAAPQETVDWQDARKHFEQAQKSGVSSSDQPRLEFFQAKVLHHFKSDPEGI